MRKSVFFVIVLLIATILACDFSASTANIDDAKMTKDSEGKQSTTIFAQDETFYAIVEVANAPDDTKVKAVWMVVEADGDACIPGVDGVLGMHRGRCQGD